MNQLYILFVVFPLLTALALLPLGRRERLRRFLSVGSLGVLWLFSLLALARVYYGETVVLWMGNWPPPFGIILVADVLSSLMVAVALTIALAALLFSLATPDPQRERYFFHPLFQILLMGINGSFLTGDIFNLFVFFEVLLIASYALMVLGSEEAQLRETIKYLVINLVASTFFVVALALLYGVMGTLNMADLAQKAQGAEDSRLLVVISFLFLFVFGTKAAIFPLYFWLPGPYYPPPAAVTAIFGGLLTKVGVYAILRTFTLIFVTRPSLTHEILLILSAFTMILGVLGAISQMDFKRILSYHIISQIGYMILGIGLYSPLALAGSIFYIVHHVIVKSSLFLISGAVEHLAGTTQLKRLGGLIAPFPGLAVLFLVAGLSLAGFPPLSGFFSKLILLQAGLEAERYFYVGVGLLGSFLTLFSMMKVWNGVFWGEGKEAGWANEGQRGTYLALLPGIGLLVALTLLIGLLPQPLFALTSRAAQQIFDPQVYIQAVLGSRSP